jgi:hypothetical protein
MAFVLSVRDREPAGRQPSADDASTAWLGTGDLSAFQIPKPLLHTTGLRCTTLRDHAETILETASVEAW